jgi:hypothetical protein
LSWAASHFSVNVVKHVVKILVQLMIPISFDAVSTGLQVSHPRLVHSRAVLTSVELDHEFHLKAYEIDDERTDRLLTAEFEFGKPAIAECTPQFPLDIGLITPQLAREPTLQREPLTLESARDARAFSTSSARGEVNTNPAPALRRRRRRGFR